MINQSNKGRRASEKERKNSRKRPQPPQPPQPAPPPPRPMTTRIQPTRGDKVNSWPISNVLQFLQERERKRGKERRKSSASSASSSSFLRPTELKNTFKTLPFFHSFPDRKINHVSSQRERERERKRETHLYI